MRSAIRVTEEIELSRSRFGISLVCAASVVVLVASPSRAETFAIVITSPNMMPMKVAAPGELTISVPDGPVSVGSGMPGTVVSGQLGEITVTDERAAPDAAWVASVTASDYTTGGGTAAETILKGSVSYWSGSATATTGQGTYVPGQADAAARETLSVSRTAFSRTAASGDGIATWNPTLVINIPSQAVAGTYTGTVSHSVA
jgi:hypothetical protein